jgi:hypothetical protein
MGIERKPELIKVGETYLKFDYEYSKANQVRIKEAYLNQVDQSSRQLFKNREIFKISIEYEKGSLKTRVVIWGTITTLYLGIANYGSFRAGLRELINDARWFSENVIERIDDGPNINHSDIIRTERRKALPGRIQELYNRIDRLERNLNNLSNNQTQTELQRIKQEVSNLVTVLPNQDAQEFLNDLGQDYSQNLPSPDDRRTTYLMNRYGLISDEEIEFINE